MNRAVRCILGAALAATVVLGGCDKQMLVGTMSGDFDAGDALVSFPPDVMTGAGPDVSAPGTPDGASQDEASRDSGPAFDASVIPDAPPVDGPSADGNGTCTCTLVDSGSSDPVSYDGVMSLPCYCAMPWPGFPGASACASYDAATRCDTQPSFGIVTYTNCNLVIVRYGGISYADARVYDATTHELVGASRMTDFTLPCGDAQAVRVFAGIVPGPECQIANVEFPCDDAGRPDNDAANDAGDAAPDAPPCPSSARAPVACVAADAASPESPIENCPASHQTLRREEMFISSLRANALGVYWLGSDHGLRVLRDGAAAPQLLGFTAPQPFTLSDDVLYFATGEEDAALLDIRSVKPDGTSLVFLASGAFPGTDIAVGGNYVYFKTAADTLGVVPKVGGVPQPVVNARPISKIVADATHVYWTERSSDASSDATSTIWRAPHGFASGPQRIAADLAVSAFAEQGDGLIVLSQAFDFGSGDDIASILEVPKAGGCPKVLVSLPRSRCSCRVTAVVADDRSIYWTAAQSDGSGYSIWYAPRTGGIAVKVSPALRDDNLALAPSQVFWGDVIPALRTFATLIQAMDRP